MTVLCHKRSTVHSIFKFNISQNTKCAEIIDFTRDGHICVVICEVIDQSLHT